MIKTLYQLKREVQDLQKIPSFRGTAIYKSVFQGVTRVEGHFDFNGTVSGIDKAGGEPTPELFLAKLISRGEVLTRTEKLEILDLLTKNFIFPSFFNYKDTLKKWEIVDHSKIRTFGSDLPEIKREIEKKYPDLHYTELDFSGYGRTLQCESFKKNETQASLVLIQENYNLWDSNNRKAEFGKQMIISEAPGVVSVFFDDGADKNIVHVQRPDGTTIATKTAKEMGYLVAVNTLEALSDPDYFIKALARCCEKQKTYWPEEYSRDYRRSFKLGF